MVVITIVQGIQFGREYGDSVPKPKLWGVYNVQTFVVGKDTLPPIMTDTVRWKKLVINSLTQARVYHVNDSITRFQTQIDTAKRSMTLSMGEIEYKLTYEEKDSVNFKLTGLLQRDSVAITLRKVKMRPEDFRLMGRGFHWINETPYNR